jgi:hypothetical protein
MEGKFVTRSRGSWRDIVDDYNGLDQQNSYREGVT